MPLTFRIGSLELHAELVDLTHGSVCRVQSRNWNNAFGGAGVLRNTINAAGA